MYVKSTFPTSAIFASCIADFNVLLMESKADSVGSRDHPFGVVGEAGCFLFVPVELLNMLPLSDDGLMSLSLLSV